LHKVRKAAEFAHFTQAACVDGTSLNCCIGPTNTIFTSPAQLRKVVFVGLLRRALGGDGIYRFNTV